MVRTANDNLSRVFRFMRGCSTLKLTNYRNSFSERASCVHNGKYDYSCVEYVNANTKVIIVCPLHGEFMQQPVEHTRGKGCPICGLLYRDISKGWSFSLFLEHASHLHGDKYSYRQESYVNMTTKMLITCSIHGDFKQEPNVHLKGNGCLKCSIENQSLLRIKKSALTFESRAVDKHGDLYDYFLVEYKKGKIPVKIICKIHGVFEQTPTLHIQGGGCPKCNMSKGELFISNILKNNQVIFQPQYLIKGVKAKQYLRFDFLIQDKNIIIEYHGSQHFILVDVFGGLDGFMTLKRNDEYKKRWAISNGYIFKEYTYKDSWNFIEKDIKKLLNQKIS